MTASQLSESADQIPDELGPDTFLQKPVLLHTLQTTISTLLAES